MTQAASGNIDSDSTHNSSDSKNMILIQLTTQAASEKMIPFQLMTQAASKNIDLNQTMAHSAFAGADCDLTNDPGSLRKQSI